MQGGRLGPVEIALLVSAILWMVLGLLVGWPISHRTTIGYVYGAVLGYLLGVVGGRTSFRRYPVIIEEEP